MSTLSNAAVFYGPAPAPYGTRSRSQAALRASREPQKEYAEPAQNGLTASRVGKKPKPRFRLRAREDGVQRATRLRREARVRRGEPKITLKLRFWNSAMEELRAERMRTEGEEVKVKGEESEEVEVVRTRVVGRKSAVRV